MQQFVHGINANLMKSIRRSLHSMRAKQYQIVAVTGILSDPDYEVGGWVGSPGYMHTFPSSHNDTCVYSYYDDCNYVFGYLNSQLSSNTQYMFLVHFWVSKMQCPDTLSLWYSQMLEYNIVLTNVGVQYGTHKCWSTIWYSQMLEYNMVLLTNVGVQYGTQKYWSTKWYSQMLEYNMVLTNVGVQYGTHKCWSTILYSQMLEYNMVLTNVGVQYGTQKYCTHKCWSTIWYSQMLECFYTSI